MIQKIIIIIILFTLALVTWGQNVYEKPKGETTNWISFENPTGEKGKAAMTNKGGKGSAFDRLPKGKSCVLLDRKGPGIINRIWLTIDDRNPEILRNIQLEMYWDDSKKPAVSVPLGDFFCNGLAILVPFENCFFSNPEGRSFNTSIPMPFRSAARILLTNNSDKDLAHLFYEINITTLNEWNDDMLYFHAYWNRENLTKLGVDHTVLPIIKGTGRFLGMSVGIKTNDVYKDTWWGEGEMKFYIDGDEQYPSLSSTGAEDYIGTAWGQGAYYNWYQGSPIADNQKKQWAFYRFHVQDPIYFYKDIRTTFQQIGGGDYESVLQLHKEGAPLIPVTIDQVDKNKFIRLLENDKQIPITDPEFPQGWVNFYRQDDVSSVAYFYLNKPSN
ncbi:DUF2961 domain-containing protein [Dysgonomonas sp. Marseille-P4677]|uniref:glycoside hydrolase family 172 protein n=1 Tax=Dysgonomonas sp. Marseille-P4677 TaxID=2364790 RepID=UPI0019118527|nr:glycoside hydrolase family 172 protein [Dysgonomonas sp. Marseille-P4677]MBK5720722.1 DUF2961 domain-containing protein [Dysgonomonas sp. Marseille-P4677]